MSNLVAVTDRRPRRPAVPLAPIVETRVTYRITRSGLTPRKEVWEAITTDGTWIFKREESPGTPWLVIHKATEMLVDQMSTLKECRAYVAGGHAQTQLGLLQAHDRGEHAAERVPLCGRC